MHTPATLRNRFASGDLETASGPRIVVMCFDRLDRDLAEALDAIEGRDHFTANTALGHAQDLLSELAMMLDVDAWDQAATLLSVYDYLLRLLAAANAAKSPGMVAEAARLVTELGDGFRGAVRTMGSGATAATAGASPGATVFEQAAGIQRLSVRA